MLYFATRYLKPEHVVETGVAAGFSSQPVLAAIARNGEGTLHSSEFPYFRLPGAESYIGIVVEESLKENWRLYVEGDERSLPRILADIDHVDLFHYGSDKTYTERASALSFLKGRWAKSATFVMDDIQDNFFFYDYVMGTADIDWKIFEFEGKYLGMVAFGKSNKAESLIR